MKMNYLVLLNSINSSLVRNGNNLLTNYIGLELTKSSAKTICDQISHDTGIVFNSTKDADNPEIIDRIIDYYKDNEAQDKFYNDILNKTILTDIDIDHDGEVEKVLITKNDAAQFTTDHFRTKATAIIGAGALFLCFAYLFAVTFGDKFINPDNNARFVDQIISNINSVINMIVMFFITNFYLGRVYSRKKNEKEDNDTE